MPEIGKEIKTTWLPFFFKKKGGPCGLYFFSQFFPLTTQFSVFFTGYMLGSCTCTFLSQFKVGLSGGLSLSMISWTSSKYPSQKASNSSSVIHSKPGPCKMAAQHILANFSEMHLTRIEPGSLSCETPFLTARPLSPPRKSDLNCHLSAHACHLFGHDWCFLVHGC